MCLTSRFQPDSSAYLDKRSKQYNVLLTFRLKPESPTHLDQRSKQYNVCLTFRLKPESSTHLDKRSKRKNACSSSRFKPHRPKALDHGFKNSTDTCFEFVYITMVLGQPAGLSKEVCLYVGADWLKPEVGERSRASSRCQSYHARWPVNTTSNSKALSHKCKTHSRTNAYYFNCMAESSSWITTNFYGRGESRH